MKSKADFIIHWIWTIVWALLALTGFSMVGAKYGWILDFNFALADYIHRIMAAFFVILTLLSIIYEIARNIRNKNEKQPWFIFGRSGYKLFTFITTLLFIITGAIIWICMEFNLVAAGFAMIVHEYLSYIALASVIWHIYMKSHALLTLKKRTNDHVSVKAK